MSKVILFFLLLACLVLLIFSFQIQPSSNENLETKMLNIEVSQSESGGDSDTAINSFDIYQEGHKSASKNNKEELVNSNIQESSLQNQITQKNRLIISAQSAEPLSLEKARQIMELK